MRRVLPLVLLLALAPPAPAGENADERFWEARRVMLKGDPASAAELFRVLHREDPQGEFADDCLYWMGRCWLRMTDHEPDAVVALNRLIRDHAGSRFVDDAARELAAVGDRTSVPLLKERLAVPGPAAEAAKLALAEFGVDPEEKGEEPEGEDGAAPAAADGPEEEIRRLREEVARLRAELDEVLAMLRKLLSERER